jgi:hypothetical protein
MRSTGTALFSPCLDLPSRCGLRRPMVLNDVVPDERQRSHAACRLRTCHWGGDRRQRGLLVVDRPSVRPLPAVDAAEINRSGGAGDAEVMTSRQVTVQPVPHMSLCLKFATSFIARSVPRGTLDHRTPRLGNFPNDSLDLTCGTVLARRRPSLWLVPKFGTWDYVFRTADARPATIRHGRRSAET